MKIKFIVILFTAIAVCLFSSCSKEEGEGGTATIKGKVMLRKYDNGYNTLISQSYVPNEDVFILYGDDDQTYDNDFKTSYNGEYEFKYLQKGTYKIFAYTTDTTGVSVTGYVDENRPKIPVFTMVEISENGSTVTVPDLTIIKNNKQGSSTITGKVFGYYYADVYCTDLQNTAYVPNETTYIIYGTDHTTYDNDYKTSFDGSFEFKYLQKGTYQIFVYTEDTTGAATGNINTFAPRIPVMITATITDNGQTVTTTDIKIIKH